MSKFRWLLLLSSLLSIVLFSSPAEAARLLRWSFEADGNQLEFTTEGGVQPKASLYANPTRLIIDLPGTTLKGPSVTQEVGEGIREVRVGQFNSRTTRIVVELASGYTIDPKQVKFLGVSSSQWIVEIPEPERVESSSDLGFPDEAQPSKPVTASIPVPPPRRPLPPSDRPLPPLDRTRPLPPLDRTRPLPPLDRTRPLPPLTRIPDGRIIVTIDPGHGGKDPGAIGIGGLREKDIVLPISQRVAEILERQGIAVVMTRSNDEFISLTERVQMARQARSTIFVSIHANAISLRRPDVNGIETYYHSPSSQRLAQSIHNSMLQNLDVRDRRVRRARFFVIRNNPVPAVLVETGFVTGAEDARKLADPDFRSQMAEAIAQGILQYLQQYR